MSHLFVVGANPLTSEEEKKIQEWVRNLAGWWHWIDGFWIFVDPNYNLTSAKIRDEINSISPNANIMVLQVSEIDAWAGYGPGVKDRNMFTWIRKHLWDEQN